MSIIAVSSTDLGKFYIDSLSKKLLPVNILDRILGITRRGKLNKSKSRLELDVFEFSILFKEFL